LLGFGRWRRLIGGLLSAEELAEAAERALLERICADLAVLDETLPVLPAPGSETRPPPSLLSCS
jgi:hypothetical protein